MKKKVIGLTIAGIVALSGVVSAASIWGTYKGNDIVKLTVDNRPILIASGDVPAINYNTRTMIPINLLKYAGIEYTWDNASKTVNIKKPLPKTEVVTKVVEKAVGIDYLSIMNHLKSYNVASVGLNTTGIGVETIIVTLNSNNPTNDQYNEVYYTIAYSGAALIRVTYPDGVSEISQSKDWRDFYEYRITEDQLHGKVITTGLNNSSYNNNSSNNTLTYDPVECQKIKDDAARRGGLDSGGVQYQLQMAGCPTN